MEDILAPVAGIPAGMRSDCGPATGGGASLTPGNANFALELQAALNNEFVHDYPLV